MKPASLWKFVFPFCSVRGLWLEFGSFLGWLDILGGWGVFVFYGMLVKLQQPVHWVYQSTFSTTELLRVDNQIANGYSAAAELTGPLAGLYVNALSSWGSINQNPALNGV